MKYPKTQLVHDLEREIGKYIYFSSPVSGQGEAPPETSQQPRLQERPEFTFIYNINKFQSQGLFLALKKETFFFTGGNDNHNQPHKISNNDLQPEALRFLHELNDDKAKNREYILWFFGRKQIEDQSRKEYEQLKMQQKQTEKQEEKAQNKPNKKEQFENLSLQEELDSYLSMEKDKFQRLAYTNILLDKYIFLKGNSIRFDAQGKASLDQPDPDGDAVINTLNQNDLRIGLLHSLNVEVNNVDEIRPKIYDLLPPLAVATKNQENKPLSPEAVLQAIDAKLQEQPPVAPEISRKLVIYKSLLSLDVTDPKVKNDWNADIQDRKKIDQSMPADISTWYENAPAEVRGNLPAIPAKDLKGTINAFASRPIDTCFELLGRMHPLAAMATIVALIWGLFNPKYRKIILGSIIGMGIFQATGAGEWLKDMWSDKNIDAVKNKMRELITGFKNPELISLTMSNYKEGFALGIMTGNEKGKKAEDIAKMYQESSDGEAGGPFKDTYGIEILKTLKIEGLSINNSTYKKAIELFIKPKVEDRYKGKLVNGSWIETMAKHPDFQGKNMQEVVAMLYPPDGTKTETTPPDSSQTPEGTASDGNVAQTPAQSPTTPETPKKREKLPRVGEDNSPDAA